jgi:Holliday junction resolvase RusA-like endonuclease
MSSEIHVTPENKTSHLWTQEIIGEPASKSNSRRIVRIHGNTRIIKSKKALEYRDSFLSQVNPPPVPIEGDIELEVVVWYKTRRPDLDISLIMDLLQEGLVIVNDRQIKIIKAYHQLDKLNPRSAIGLSEVSTDLTLPF